MVSQVSDRGSSDGQGVPSVFPTVSFAQKVCCYKVLARFLGNHQDHFFLASVLCAKGFIYNGFSTFCGGIFFWQDDRKGCPKLCDMTFIYI